MGESGTPQRKGVRRAKESGIPWIRKERVLIDVKRKVGDAGSLGFRVYLSLRRRRPPPHPASIRGLWYGEESSLGILGVWRDQ